MFAIASNSCSLIRKSKNKSVINFARKHTELIKECASFAISVTIDKKINRFACKDIKDKEIQNKIRSLGVNVSVNYSDGGDYEINDSIVSFETTSVSMGVTEIIYDFAYNPRSFSDRGSRNGEYYFVKVADRIYYRKSPFPMM
jgi:hypothetical protein